jgi:hypothetical protein
MCLSRTFVVAKESNSEAKLQATSTRGESTEPTKGVMKHTYKVVLYNYCLMQYCCILSYQLVSREGCNLNQWEKVSKSMDSSSIGPHAKLHKRHNALSFHHVREAVTSKYVMIFHLPGKYNPADILSKHWAYALVW